MKRSMACLLACIMTVMLFSACGRVQKEAAVDYWQNSAQEQLPQAAVPQAAVPQTDMPQEELSAAMVDIDLSLLGAGLEVSRRIQVMNAEYAYVDCAYFGDYDHDGHNEVLVDAADFIFDLSDGRSSQFLMQQSPPMYYTDKDGNVYRLTAMGDTLFNDESGETVLTSYLYFAYALWQNGAWETVICYSGEVSGKDGINTDMHSLADPSLFDNYDIQSELYGKKVSMAELADHCDSIGLEAIRMLPSSFTTRSYDAAYRDSLETQLEEYFSQQGFAWDKIRRDLDGDGAEESVFVLPGFDQLWRSNISNQNNGFREDGADWMNHLFLPEYAYTGILVVDTDGERVEVRASCTWKSVNLNSVDLRIENGFLCWDSDFTYIGGGFANEDESYVPANLVKYLADYGYDDCFLRAVDVTNMDGKEYLCFCQKNGAWYVLLIVLVNGEPETVYSSNVNNRAFYITEKDGKECLMLYAQNAFTLSNGVHRTEYSYDLLRFDEEGNMEFMASDSVGYNDDNQDATATAQFFDKLNTYLVKIIVIRDPYALTGKQWITPEQVDYGTVPTEQEETEKATMGFVQIADPASWLNLREGPGTEYDRVLLDPSDPDSFVRQALGSPVTVLETIETGDPENPVWLKIRITYGDREIIGYSSKTYIRLVDE